MTAKMARAQGHGKATLVRVELDTPLGRVVVVARDGVLVLLDFADDERRWGPLLARRFPAATTAEAADPGGAVTALAEYFVGDPAALDAVAVDPGGTAFQQRVWLALRAIRPGTVITYAELARRVGVPRGFRAVGITNGRNPISIVLPCHRVIGADGSLTGYGGGLWRKAWLLRHEGVAMPGAQLALALR
jgi:methylated-DNA-[protein]-cysteine S-methyltransferase